MKYWILVLLWNPILLSAQVWDDFSDGDLSNNPPWQGATEKFKVNDHHQLQLNDTCASLAWLSTRMDYSEDTEWQAYIRLGFSPSSNNCARFYLVSDQQNLSESLHGYFIQLGESGANDAPELFRQDGQSVVSVCRGDDGSLSGAFQVRIKVTRTGNGNWTIYMDPYGGGNLLGIASGVDCTHFMNAAMGFWCNYTVSNSDHFYFDDVYGGYVLTDSVAPMCLQMESLTDKILKLTFDEALDPLTAEQADHYQVTGQGINPSTAVYPLQETGVVYLTFENSFQQGNTIELAMTGLRDLQGNVMEPDTMNLLYYVAQPGDVVINEIMADPVPEIGLPDAEYIELFNRTDVVMDLSGWVLKVGTTTKTFEPVTINPSDWLIVTEASAISLLESYGRCYGFNTFALTNAGQHLTLCNATGDTIDELAYDTGWYGDADKATGGWSMEQINPDNRCSAGENWHASMAPEGGTPGRINSIWDNILLYPRVSIVSMLADNILRVTFNQRMDTATLLNASLYTVQGIGHPDYCFEVIGSADQADLYYAGSFDQGVVYDLIVSISLTNCMGLPLAEESVFSFGIPDEPNKTDVIINEVLFNPWSSGVDYLELYNRSLSVIDLKELQLLSVRHHPPEEPDTAFYQLSSQQYLLTPGRYCLLTTAPSVVQDQYMVPFPEVLLEMEPFPAMPNDSGHILLTDIQLQLIDEVHYHEDMHFPLLTSVEGVALERIDSDGPSLQRSNWHSASETSGFGTPGYINSQLVHGDKMEEAITLWPELFTPDNDGYHDITEVRYQFDVPGLLMTVIVYDVSGQQINILASNSYVGAAGSWNWDGTNTEYRRAASGIYVIMIQVHDLDGQVHVFKRACVLAESDN